MLLYTCPARTIGGSAPVVKHPCGRAAKALEDAGHSYETEVVGGFKTLGFTRRGKRDKIRELTGQEDVPVLILDGGEAIAGTDEIVAWARSHPA